MNEQKIRERAYALWQQEGCPHGRDTEYWLRAEAELLDGPDAPKGIYVQTATGSASEPWVLTRGYAGSAASQQQRLVAKASPLWTLAEKGVLHPWAMVTDVDAPLAKLAAQLRPPFSPCVRTEAAIHAKIGRMRKMQRTAAAPQIKPVAFGNSAEAIGQLREKASAIVAQPLPRPQQATIDPNPEPIKLPGGDDLMIKGYGRR